MDALNRQVSGAEWANGNSGKLKSSLFGSMEGVNNVGDLVNRVANPGKVEGFQNKLNTSFGYNNDYLSQGKRSLETIDSELAGKIQSGDLAGAGALFNQIAFQTEASGGSQQDAMKMFPQYKDAVYGVFTQRGQQVDDNTLLQAMRSDRGFRRGGYTGNGSVTDPVDVVHGREYVFDAGTTARIGVDNLRAMHQGRTVPSSTATHFSPTVNITAGAGANGAEIRAHVDQALREAERRMRNTHGTRSKVGAR